MRTTFPILGLMIFLSCCALKQHEPHPQQKPSLNSKASINRTTCKAPQASSITISDGYILPVSSWRPKGEITAVILALHGFNDYRHAFSETGKFLARHGVITYAYDQRGFGETSGTGLWAGIEPMINDLRTLIHLLRIRHPGLPLFLMGESMGGAVIMTALDQPDPIHPDGIILIAPAVWSRATMPWYQRVALWLGARIVPSLKVSGRGLHIIPSDNVEMLQSLYLDPLVIKETRIDTLDGLTNLMDAALKASGHLHPPTLILYGDHDEIIPRKAVCRMLRALPPFHQGKWQLLLYPDGYHMLTRDLQADVVRNDIYTWISQPNAPLPSGHEWQRGDLASDCSNLWRHMESPGM